MKQITLVLFSLLLPSTAGWSEDYTKKREVRVFIDRMVKHYHFNRTYLNNLFSHVKFQKRALAIYVPKYRKKWKPPKRRKKQGPWDRYEEIFLKPAKVSLA